MVYSAGTDIFSYTFGHRQQQQHVCLQAAQNYVNLNVFCSQTLQMQYLAVRDNIMVLTTIHGDFMCIYILISHGIRCPLHYSVSFFLGFIF